jgi:hypothetical protein
MAREMVRRHGRPREITDSRLVWKGVFPFNRIVVRADEFAHDLVENHLDCLEHVVPYIVPLEAVASLYEFSSAIVVDRQAQEILARCRSVEVNLIHLNIAHYIIVDRWSPEKAKDRLLSELHKVDKGLETELAERILFAK